MATNRTRIVELRRGVERGEADNRRTGVMVADKLPSLPFARLFPVAWEELRRLLCSFTVPGVVVVAVDSIARRVAGTLCLAAKVGQANAAIVGRHGHCDLYLEGDPALSLRHLAIVVSPLVAGEKGLSSQPQVGFRVLDLRTRSAFLDEHGRRLESVTAEGPTFLSAGGHALFIVVSGEDPVWPESASEAWKCIPERVYLDEKDAEPDRWKRRRSPGRGFDEPTDGGGLAAGTGVVDQEDLKPPVVARPSDDAARITLVRTQPGPARARVSLIAEDDLEVGQISVTAEGKSQRIAVGERSVEAGILLGRYERCDTHGASVVAHHGISRVHLLLLQVAGEIYAVDTGSTNGTFRGGPGASDAEVRIVKLEDNTELVLGEDLVHVKWKPSRPA